MRCVSIAETTVAMHVEASHCHYAPLVMRLSGDALVEMAKWLNSQALGALVLCGNKPLNRMLATQVRTLAHYSASTRRLTWPFYIRGLTALTHLTIQLNPLLDVNHLNGVETVTALATLLLESLPHSLVSLQLTHWPLPLKAVFRNLWQRHTRPADMASLQGQFSSGVDTTPQDDNASNDSEPQLLSHMSGTLVMLRHFYLPKLQDFSLKIMHRATEMDEATYADFDNLYAWVSRATPLPLTRIALSNVILPKQVSLCEILKALPRTLTYLSLKADNTNHCHAYNEHVDLIIKYETGERALLLGNADEAQTTAACALPPHLTHLKLDLTTPSYLPTTLLSNLSQLQTLKLAVREIYTPPSSMLAIRSTLPLRILAHLPASVSTLSLMGYSIKCLEAGLNAIPRSCGELRQLTIQLIIMTSTFDVWRRLLACIARYPQLELLCIHSRALRVPDIDVIEPGSNHGCIREIQDAMANMMQLRTVSSIFVQPLFMPFWKQVMPHLTATSPMRVCTQDGLSVTFNDEWIDFWKRATNAPHIEVERLIMSPAVKQLLSHHVISNESNTLLDSVKRLTLDLTLDHTNIGVLGIWPKALDSICLINHTWPFFIDSSVNWSTHSVSALRELYLDGSVGIEDLNAWLRALPTTLETLRVWGAYRTRVPAHQYDTRLDNTFLLSYMPPRLKSMTFHGGFAIGTKTFDAMPPSLTKAEWVNVDALHCGTIDMCRWPKHIQRIYLSTARQVRMSSGYTHNRKVMKQWCEQAEYLESFFVSYLTNKGGSTSFEYTRP